MRSAADHSCLCVGGAVRNGIRVENELEEIAVLVRALNQLISLDLSGE